MPVDPVTAVTAVTAAGRLLVQAVAPRSFLFPGRFVGGAVHTYVVSLEGRVRGARDGRPRAPTVRGRDRRRGRDARRRVPRRTSSVMSPDMRMRMVVVVGRRLQPHVLFDQGVAHRLQTALLALGLGSPRFLRPQLLLHVPHLVLRRGDLFAQTLGPGFLRVQKRVRNGFGALRAARPLGRIGISMCFH